VFHVKFRELKVASKPVEEDAKQVKSCARSASQEFRTDEVSDWCWVKGTTPKIVPSGMSIPSTFG